MVRRCGWSHWGHDRLLTKPDFDSVILVRFWSDGEKRESASLCRGDYVCVLVDIAAYGNEKQIRSLHSQMNQPILPKWSTNKNPDLLCRHLVFEIQEVGFDFVDEIACGGGHK